MSNQEFITIANAVKLENANCKIRRLGEVVIIEFEDATLTVIGNLAHWKPTRAKLMDDDRVEQENASAIRLQKLLNVETGEETTEAFKRDDLTDGK